jgi:hypothetical protein
VATKQSTFFALPISELRVCDEGISTDLFVVFHHQPPPFGSNDVFGTRQEIFILDLFDLIEKANKNITVFKNVL